MNTIRFTIRDEVIALAEKYGAEGINEIEFVARMLVRDQLQKKLEAQSKRDPDSFKEHDYVVEDTNFFGNAYGEYVRQEICTEEELRGLVTDEVERFMWNCQDGVDLAMFATDLLTYVHGPTPEIEILPKKSGELYKVTGDLN